MNVRFNNNRHHVKTKLKSCELTSHFIENPNHDIDRDLEITSIEQLRKTETMTEENKKELLKKREIFWQETLHKKERKSSPPTVLTNAKVDMTSYQKTLH